MPGFRFCHWCNGKGCIGCDAEQKRFAKEAAASAPAWREPDVRDTYQAALKAETTRLESEIGVSIGSIEQFREAEVVAHAAIEAEFRPALDAEYARQFPGGPVPAFVARIDNPADMALLAKVAGRQALEETFADGVTAVAVSGMHRSLDEIRTIQAARKVLCPNDHDLAREA